MASFFDRFKNKKNPILSNMDSILYNRFVLYFVFAISLYQLFIFSSKQDYIPAITFILVGFTTSFFSRNMLVILTVALVIMNLLKFGAKGQMEGFESTDDMSLRKMLSTLSDKLETKPEKKNGNSEKSDATKITTMNEMKDGYKDLVKIKDDIADGLIKAIKGLDEAETKVTKLKETLKNAQ